MSSWSPAAPGQELPVQVAPGLGRALSWSGTVTKQPPSGLQCMAREPSSVWHFRCAAELQTSVPSQECGCTALAKPGQKCFKKEEREESQGRKSKCSVSASERCVGRDSSITLSVQGAERVNCNSYFQEGSQ